MVCQLPFSEIDRQAPVGSEMEDERVCDNSVLQGKLQESYANRRGGVINSSEYDMGYNERHKSGHQGVSLQ